MQIHNVQQGTQEWLELRSKCYTASEAPAMMGQSKYQSRDELLLQKATGEAPEVDEFTQKLFDKGHETEASIRSHIESIIKNELYPATASAEIDGLRLLASFDGITDDACVVFEHKLYNEKLYDDVIDSNLSPNYYWQLEHQLLVSDANIVIFVTSNGTPDKMAYCQYTSIPERRAALIAGWKQFDIDLKTYTPGVVTPSIVGKEIMPLPALSIDVTGRVNSTNIDAFISEANIFIKNINTDLKTDEDFANAEKIVTFCDKSEKQLEMVKEQAIAKMADINAVFRAIDEVKEELRSNRLKLDKLVKAEKINRKNDIIDAGKKEFYSHVEKLNNSLGRNYMPAIAHGFNDAVKNKRTISSIQSAVNDEIARLKILTNEIAEKIRKNMGLIDDSMMHLFPDIDRIITKEYDDFILLVESRKEEERAREAKRKELDELRVKEEERAREVQESISVQDAKVIKEPEETNFKEKPKAKQNNDIDALYRLASGLLLLSKIDIKLHDNDCINLFADTLNNINKIHANLIARINELK